MTSDKAVSVELRLNALLGNPWQNFGNPSNGWGVGGHAKFRKNVDNCLIVAIKDLTVGTATDGTTVWNANNGLPAGYAPANSHRVVCWCDRTAVFTSVPEMSGLEFMTDGSVICWGISGTASRVDLDVIFPIDQ